MTGREDLQRWQPGDDGWEWVEPPYDGPARPMTPPVPPWYRRPGVLVGLIIVAMVALVVASVVLLTNARFGESDEVRLQPTVHTSAVPEVPSQTLTEAPTTEAPTEPTRSTAPSEEPGPVGETQPQAPASAPQGPAGGPAHAPATPGGPKINVTRNPMSFNPHGH